MSLKALDADSRETLRTAVINSSSSRSQGLDIIWDASDTSLVVILWSLPLLTSDMMRLRRASVGGVEFPNSANRMSLPTSRSSASAAESWMILKVLEGRNENIRTLGNSYNKVASSIKFPQYFSFYWLFIKIIQNNYGCHFNIMHLLPNIIFE